MGVGSHLMKLIIEVVVGYMYKVQKNGLNVSNFHDEFAAIRHGDYFKFFNLIGKEIHFIVTYDEGEIKKNKNVEEEDIAIVALTKSAESLKDFHKRCYQEFGDIDDPDLSDEDFERAALFELSLRIHSNNKRLSRNETTFENVINSLSLSDSEKSIMHEGRRFLNNIKRPKKMKSPWVKSLEKFNHAYKLMIEKELTIM